MADIVYILLTIILFGLSFGLIQFLIALGVES